MNVEERDRLLSVLGKKWTSKMLLLFVRRNPLFRFNEIQSQLNGISPKVLTIRLLDLEDVGLLRRKVYGRKYSPNIEYKITALGRKVVKMIKKL